MTERISIERKQFRFEEDGGINKFQKWDISGLKKGRMKVGLCAPKFFFIWRLASGRYRRKSELAACVFLVEEIQKGKIFQLMASAIATAGLLQNFPFLVQLRDFGVRFEQTWSDNGDFQANCFDIVVAESLESLAEK
ncbi:unnamed protein product [Strongylus vulgaris]|uniref:Uncharacterized protein n=1 Tax=Strongylus vulgaris TaxID=40348 RepID=A0A3P7LBG0_STRVU|nr:unnamed protein product [Strongylus vulgaris]